MKRKIIRLPATTPKLSWAEAILDDLKQLGEGPDIIPLPPDLPEWVENVIREVLKAIYPRQAVKPGQITPASVGLFLGRHYALHAMLFAGELPVGAKTEQEAEALLKKLDEQTVSPEQEKKFEAVMESMESQQSGFRTVVAQAFTKALEQPAPEALAFIHAFAKASRLKPDALASEYMMTHSLRLYFILFMIWPVVERFESIAALHRALSKGLKHQAGNLKSFEKLCQHVGLKLRPPGRPSK